MNTKEEAREFNRLCSEFIGRDYDTEIYSQCTNELYERGHRNPDFIENDLNWSCYHSDWNWIMEVVENISKKTIENQFLKDAYINWLIEFDFQDFLSFRLSKESTVRSINSFLNFINAIK